MKKVLLFIMPIIIIGITTLLAIRNINRNVTQVNEASKIITPPKKEEVQNTTKEKIEPATTTNNSKKSTTTSNNKTKVTISKKNVITTKQNTTISVVTTRTTTTKTCTPKKFIWSWFRADFETQSQCENQGERFMDNYGYSCSYLQDDCGKTYWMLSLFDDNGNYFDWHNVH